MEAPHIIAITELRRHASRVLDGPVADDVPVFVTQRGQVTAVILSRAVFDRLAKGERRTPWSGASHEDADRSPVPRGTGIESFGPLPRGTLFETPWNLVDAETAAFFMEEGIPVRPHLEGWLETGAVDAVTDDVSGRRERAGASYARSRRRPTTS